MSIFKNKYFLYLYLFIAISIGWYYNHIGKTYVKKYDVMVMLLIETLSVLVCISLYLAYHHGLSLSSLKKEIYKIDSYDYLLLLGFALYGIFASFIGLKFLEHHDVAKLRLSDFVISIPITVAGLYYFSNERLTLDKKIGVAAVILGGYMYLK